MASSTILNYPNGLSAVAFTVLADSDVPKIATVKVATVE